MLRHFQACQSGSVKLLFGASMMPFALGLGSVVDYGRASTMKVKLQAAADAAVLSLARDGYLGSESDLHGKAQRFFEGAIAGSIGESEGPRRRFLPQSIVVVREHGAIKMTVKGSVPTTILSLAGMASVGLTVTTEAAMASGSRHEIRLKN